MYEIDKKTGGIMYCYRGIKYNTKDLKKQVKKAKKSDTVTSVFLTKDGKEYSIPFKDTPMDPNSF